MRVRFRFLHTAGGVMYWESVLPIAGGESRYEQVWCSADWFWGRKSDDLGPDA